jgi:hypothetical protein
LLLFFEEEEESTKRQRPPEVSPMRYKLRDRFSVNRLAAATAAIAGLTLAACAASTTLEQTWTTPTVANQPPLQKVVTVFSSDNVTIRRSGEDQLARDLRAKGVDAMPSYAVLRESEKPESDAVKSKLLAMGYDGIVTMRIVERYQELEYMPSSFGGYWGYGYPYFYYSPGFYSPGYAYTETVVRVETNAYSLRTNQLVWSGLTKTRGDEADKLIDDTSRVIARQLTRRGLAA